MKGWNLHIVRNDVIHDARVLKETASLASCGLFEKVAIAGLHNGRGSEHEELGDNRLLWRVPLQTRGLPKDIASQTIKFAEWQRRIVARYKNTPLEVIHCHDLAPLPIAVALKKRTGGRIVYDAHELQAEMSGLAGMRKLLAKQVERKLIRHVDAMITVSPSIKAWYEREFPGMPVTLVRNVPHRQSPNNIAIDLKQKLGISRESLLFIYLGGLSRGRGIRLMLEAFADERVSHHLLFMGDGPLKAEIAQASQANSRIHWHAPVSPEKVIDYAGGADVGISFIEDSCLSYRYCLPNKLFECLTAGLPVVVSDLPDQSALVRELAAGWTAPADASSLIRLLERLQPGEVEAVAVKLRAQLETISWEQESAHLLELYETMLETQERTN